MLQLLRPADITPVVVKKRSLQGKKNKPLQNRHIGKILRLRPRPICMFFFMMKSLSESSGGRFWFRAVWLQSAGRRRRGPVCFGTEWF